MIKVAALVLPLCLDTFAIAAAVGVQRPRGAERLRLGAVFAAFEGGMPLVGLLLGLALAQLLAGAAEYVAIAVLAGAGLWMLRGDDDDAEGLRSARGLRLVMLGLSVSLDELAIGFTMGLLRVPAVLVVALIALQAFLVSQLGFALGAIVGERVREGAERLAGGLLILLALFLLVTRL
ncbi:MAG: hypothetical protein E6I08_11235 [Chloroflexi bacterium]|nr:MAG: hypothetical protein E6I08_11235 [Chloroflexota bacterium]